MDTPQFSCPTPFTPHPTDEEALAWLRLIRSRKVGPATFWRLLAEHGSARAALEALPDIARASGITDYTPCPEGVAQAELRAARKIGARMILRGAAAYPAALADLSDAPPILWALGNTDLLSRPMVAIVGARSASSLGERMARKLAVGLGAAGVTVVSGLARGIDAAAHEAALATGTIAVQAGGVDVVYPSENTALTGRIGEAGLRLSEQPVGLEPQARHFPARNRIIAGLSRAVIVVEAAAQSGSLITARAALDLGREVMAVPGHPLDARASGPNILIRDGAVLVRGAEDVLTALELPVTAQPAPQPEPIRSAAPDSAAKRGLRDVAALHRQILDRLAPSPIAEDQLLRDLRVPAAQLAPELLTLELEGRIARQAGGLLSRVS